MEVVDVKKTKREIVEVFTEAVNKCGNVEDLVLLLFRSPACGHPCSISEVIMDVLEKNGVDEDVYWWSTTPEEDVELDE